MVRRSPRKGNRIISPVRFPEKISRNAIPANLLWEKNTVPTEKTSWKVRIIRQANMALCHQLPRFSSRYSCEVFWTFNFNMAGTGVPDWWSLDHLRWQGDQYSSNVSNGWYWCHCAAKQTLLPINRCKKLTYLLYLNRRTPLENSRQFREATSFHRSYKVTKLSY